MKTAAFYTLGCKVNQYETEAMTELFIKSGYSIVEFDSPADVYVVNTCTVTSMSDRKSRQIIRRAKRQNPNGFLVVCGCYAQTAPDAVKKIPDVDLILGTNEHKNIVELVEMHTRQVCVDKISARHDFEQLDISGYSKMTRAYVKVQEGCNQFCSYCIIPYARGPIRSRPLDDAISEVKRLAKNGFSEVIFVGIHIASYGLDTKEGDLADLILEANKIDGIKRIRLSSIEPMTLTPDFIKRISAAEKLCPHFHLSLQSGDDDTLKRMNRRYTTDEYYGIVTAIRENFPDSAITTDIMVGFPGETDEEFENTCSFAQKVSFSGAHIFQYSQRPGTPADKMPDQIDPKIKDLRSKQLISITSKTESEFISGFIGRKMSVLFEERSANGLYEGKTANYITVFAASDEELANQYRTVLLTKAADGGLFGEILDNAE